MFLLLALILVILWAGGFFVMHVSSLFIHLLIIFAVISLIFHLLGGRKS
ncbi:lmo0937 family membrane protein [Granulicella cerasi]|uniref:Lmo0937 family membrane protein n=1 Tax=Granulicella cerasi TaxID=741063 RepID=A0ABW1Z3H9_9BACT|nr:lmo0937 family membrane protein [Granulicella cerasi]